MDKPLRQRLAPEARKLEIVEAAERALRARGRRVRVEDVVREAGMAKGAFFLCFPSWDDLLETIRERIVDQFHSSNPLPTERERPVDWPEVLTAQADAYIDHTLLHRGIGEAVFHSPFARRRPLLDDAILRLTAIIRAGREAEAFGAVDPEPTARLLFAAIEETANVLAAGGEREPVMATLHDFLGRSLAP